MDTVAREQTTRRRQRLLHEHFDIARQFEVLEESCVPSYVHANTLAAWVAWERLRQAAGLYRKWAPAGDVLDFGSATGEVGHLIDVLDGGYSFVEQNDVLANALLTWLPDATRTRLDQLESKKYSAVFALDSLEHNNNVEEPLRLLQAAIADSGVLILSGPTENLLYRLGRRIAGFSGHYHFQNIGDIEEVVERDMIRLERKVVPKGISLFSVTAWRMR